MNKTYVRAAGIVLAVLFGVGLAMASTAGDGSNTYAAAKLAAAGGSEIGTVEFSEVEDGTRVDVDLSVPAGSNTTGSFQGFHIHSNSDPSNGQGCVADPAASSSTWFVAVDGHWKQGDEVHGKHRGDLPPMVVDAKGKVSASFVTRKMTEEELVNKAVVLHAGPDNFGNIPLGDAPNQYRAVSPAAATATANTGNAGDRVACGIIEAS